MSEASEDLFEIANLYPATTGLPMTVWVSPRGAARHDVRIKVNIPHGNRMTIANTAIVAGRPVPRVVTGQLPSTDEQSVFAWVTLNEDALVAYWEGRVDTAGLVQQLRRV
jgi:alkylated DNA nucleotide flippase Atl1